MKFCDLVDGRSTDGASPALDLNVWRNRRIEGLRGARHRTGRRFQHTGNRKIALLKGARQRKPTDDQNILVGRGRVDARRRNHGTWIENAPQGRSDNNLWMEFKTIENFERNLEKKISSKATLF